MSDPQHHVIDPDLDHTDATLDVPRQPRRHRITVHRFITVALIGLGGAGGTLARWGLEAWLPIRGRIPWTTMGINVAGAGLLGALLAWLACSGPDKGWRRRVRLSFGTGLLGGFTTYSAFSVETVTLLRMGTWWPGVAYVVLTLVGGLLAAGLGDHLTTAMLKRCPAELVAQEAE